jgi:hypothetical protein
MSKKTKKLDPTLAETIRKKIQVSQDSQYKIAKDSGVDSGTLSRFVESDRFQLKLPTSFAEYLAWSWSTKE